jgi:hypothetical protein
VAWLIPYAVASAIGAVVYRDRRRVALVVALAAAAYPFAALVALDAERDRTPLVYDGALARLDGAAGHALIAASVRALRASTALRGLAKWVYDWNLPIALLFAAAMLRRERLAIALGAAGVLGLACYLIVPAVGPREAPTDYRNAMPSVHFAVTLIAAIASRGRARWLAVAFVVLTAIATLGFGEHYVIDLAVAVPFALAIWLGANGRPRAALAPALAVLVTLLVIRRNAHQPTDSQPEGAGPSLARPLPLIRPG